MQENTVKQKTYILLMTSVLMDVQYINLSGRSAAQLAYIKKQKAVISVEWNILTRFTVAHKDK